MADIQLELTTPSATQSTDRLLARRGAGPADHTIELVTPSTLKGFLALTAADVSGLAAIATSGSASDLGSGTLPAARFDDTAHGSRAGGTLHANVVAAGAAGFMTGADKTKLDGIAAGAQVNVPTDLAYTASTRLLASSTGADVTLPLVASADAGLAPASGGGTTNFLRADGTWATPSGGTGTDLGYTASTRLLTSSTGADVTLPLVASADAGLAPASGGGTTNFLRADGTWAAPGGGGATNLAWVAATSTVTSDTGTDATLTVADGTNPGLMTSANFTKLAGITGTNTGDQNLFGTIAVSGQSNVVADTTSDTLTLVAGTNVTITTDAGADSITISASGSGGGPDTYDVRTISGTTGTFATGDNNNQVDLTNAGTKTITMDTFANVALADQSFGVVVNKGAGLATFDVPTGVTLNGVAGPSSFTFVQNARVFWYKTGNDVVETVLTEPVTAGAFNYGLAVAMKQSCFFN
ncbi:MAG: hypothetical protein ACRC14_12075 [Paracoccaceae bacterium]